MSATTHRAPQVPGQPGAAGVVARAASHIEGFAVRTPLQPNTRLSELGAQVLLKQTSVEVAVHAMLDDVAQGERVVCCVPRRR